MKDNALHFTHTICDNMENRPKAKNDLRRNVILDMDHRTDQGETKRLMTYCVVRN